MNKYTSTISKKVLCTILICAIGVLHIAACSHEHQYIALENGINICDKCEKTECDINGHTMKPATCTDPSTCTICSHTEGAALGGQHTCDMGICGTCGDKVAYSAYSELAKHLHEAETLVKSASDLIDQGFVYDDLGNSYSTTYQYLKSALGSLDQAKIAYKNAIAICNEYTALSSLVPPINTIIDKIPTEVSNTQLSGIFFLDDIVKILEADLELYDRLNDINNTLYPEVTTNG